LTDTERAVIEMRYGIFSGQPMTLDQVGRRLDYTRENVRLIELKAIAKLKHPSRAQLLRDYLNDAS
jgi:RNA polymerase primary sigma factor